MTFLQPFGCHVFLVEKTPIIIIISSSSIILIYYHILCHILLKKISHLNMVFFYMRHGYTGTWMVRNICPNKLKTFV